VKSEKGKGTMENFVCSYCGYSDGENEGHGHGYSEIIKDDEDILCACYNPPCMDKMKRDLAVFLMSTSLEIKQFRKVLGWCIGL
jgi:hypothetical protein